MANIILDEKRFLDIGEVCAIHLKHLKAVHLLLDCDIEDGPEDVDIAFYGGNEAVFSTDEIVFVKYVGYGMFVDLLSDQLFMTSVYNVDDMGTAELLSLNERGQNEIEKIQNLWSKIHSPKAVETLKKSFPIFMKNPLVIDISSAPFYSLSSSLAMKFALQSPEQIKSKIILAKANAQQNLEQEYNQLKEEIFNFYTKGIIPDMRKV